MNRRRGVAAVVLVAALAGCSSEAPAVSAPQTTETSPPASSLPATPGGSPETPSEAPPVTPGADGWIPLELIAEGRYRAISLVVDASGVAHVAAQGSSGIWYLTNAGGEWVRERLTATARHEVHDSVAIALDEADGSLWVAHAQRRDDQAPNFSRAVSYVNNQSGAWSQPIDIPGSSELRALEATGGSIHLASEDQQAEGGEDLQDIFRPLYITNAGGDWAAVPLAKRGSNFAIEVSDDGRVEMIIESWQPGTGQVTVYQASRAAGAGSFEIQPIIEGLALHDTEVIAALDPAGVPHLILGERLPDQATYVRGLGDGQTKPKALPFVPREMVVDAQGAVHGVSDDRYITNAGGAFANQDLDCRCEPRQSNIAVDAEGRPHVVISSRLGIWYAVGPRR